MLPFLVTPKKIEVQTETNRPTPFLSYLEFFVLILTAWNATSIKVTASLFLETVQKVGEIVDIDYFENVAF